MNNSEEELIINNLESEGFAIMKDVISLDECNKMVLALEEAEKNILQGNKFDLAYYFSKRNLQIFNVHYQIPNYFLNLISNQKIIRIMQDVLNDKLILSNFNASKSLKSSEKEYRIHIDSRKPNPNFSNTYQMVAIICLNEFTANNGSTVVVPGSHKSGHDPRNKRFSDDDLLTITAKKGSVIFIPGQTWHDVGQNFSGETRWGIIAYYSCWWIKPTYDFVNSCTEEIFNKLSYLQKELLGFNTRPPIDWNKRQQTVTRIEDLPENLNDAILWDG